MIESSGARTIADIFRLVPGFLVTHDRGNKLVVSYHGLTDKFSRQMQVLIDGRSVYIPAIGGVSWANLPLSISDIYRIEVTRGPNAVTYGANAFMAVINIQTYSGAALPSKSFHSTTRDINDNRVMFRVAGAKRNLEYRITGETDRNDIFDRMNDKRIGNHFSARLDYKISTNDSLLFETGLLNGRIGEGFTGSNDNPPRDQHILNHFIQLRYSRVMSSDQDFYIQIFAARNDENDDFIVPNFGGGPVPVDYDLRSDRLDFEFQHRFRLNKNMRIAWGFNKRLDQVTSVTYFAHMGKVAYKMDRIFGNLEWYITPKLSTNIGTMFENNNFTGSENSPRFAVNYSPMKNHTFRFIHSKATRTPAVLEEKNSTQFWIPHLSAYYIFREGNPDLESERIISKEIGYYGVLGKTAKLDLKIFRDSISNLVSTVTSSSTSFGIPIRTFSNTDNVKLSGFETQLELTPDKKNRVFLGYSRIKTKGEDIGDNFTTSVPTHTVSLLVSHALRKDLKLNFAYYNMGSYKPLDGEQYHGFERLDLSFYKYFKTGNMKGKIGLIAQNVLNDYLEYRPQNKFEDAVFLNLELNSIR
jgi:iron complex outermembrane receptor protein